VDRRDGGGPAETLCRLPSVRYAMVVVDPATGARVVPAEARPGAPEAADPPADRPHRSVCRGPLHDQPSRPDSGQGGRSAGATVRPNPRTARWSGGMSVPGVIMIPGVREGA
jgi:hypothetical protein